MTARDSSTHELLAPPVVVATMLGMCQGLLADGVLSKDEILALDEWMRERPRVAIEWPGKQIATRLARVLEDGKIDDIERNDMQELLEAVLREASAKYPRVTGAPPPIEAELAGRHVALMGKFAAGERAVAGAVRMAQGILDRALDERTEIVVLGFGVERTRRSAPRVQQISERDLLSALTA